MSAANDFEVINDDAMIVRVKDAIEVTEDDTVEIEEGSGSYPLQTPSRPRGVRV